MPISIDDLLTKVAAIADEYAPQEKKKPESDEKVDEFTAKKREISSKIRTIRADLKEREGLLERSSDSKKTAEMSQKIRTQIKATRENIDELSAIQKKEAKKARKKSPEIQQAVASRGEIVELCYQHLAECESWEKRRVPERMSAETTSLMAGASSGKRASTMSTGAGAGAVSNPFDDSYNPMVSNLADIEDYSDQLQELRGKNAEIDADLEEILAGVRILKGIAIEMGNEIEMQNVMVDEIQTKVEKSNVKIQTLNQQLKKQIDGVMKGDKFLVNFVLLLILLACIAFVVTQFT